MGTKLIKTLVKNPSSLKSYLEKGDIKVVDEYGDTLLHYAAAEGTAEVVTLLLKYFDPNVTDNLFQFSIRDAVAVQATCEASGVHIESFNSLFEMQFITTITNG